MAATAAHDDGIGASDRPVDLVHLAKYTMGNRDLEHEVLNLFAKQSVIYLDRLAKAADKQTWAEAAHTLKGSARGIGAWQVAEAAAAIEKLSFGVGSLQKSEMMRELVQALNEANSFIEGLLAGETVH